MHKKQKKLFKMILTCLGTIILISVLEQTQVNAATYDYVATKLILDGTQVGRYRLNYTGNTNYFDIWQTNGALISGVTYNDAGNYINSSTATLSPQTISSTITKAYLVWDARATAFENNTTTPSYSVNFMTPNGGRYTIPPTYSISDNRNLGDSGRNYAHYYCMAADVTDIVKRSGFGNYSVCNIPRWNPSWTHKDWKGEYPGGDSVGAWQLVIIEESKDFSVRAVSLSIASEFHLATDFTGSLNLGSGLKSKTNGSTNGQFLFAAVRSGSGDDMTETITTKNSLGIPITNVVGNTMSHPGLFKNGQLVNNRDYATGGMCIDLSEVSNIGNSIVAADLAVQNTSWTTFHMLGISMDIAYPDFVGTQTTTVNSSTSATVNGQFINTAGTPDTGIYNGSLTVDIDSGLTPISAVAIVNETSIINGTISGNRVTFRGNEVANMMNGTTISYTIQCSTENSGKAAFNNSAGFHGYLRSDGVNTGYWINDIWTAVSSAAAKYKVIINQGTGVESVKGSGEYVYGADVKPTVELKPGYHWSSWTGSYTTPWQDFNFQMPAGDITLTANGEANQYTILFDSNEGEGHMDSITAAYDALLTLPENTFTRSNGYGPSVFRGWNIISDTFDVRYSDMAEVINLTTENNATVTLYAIWDDIPWVNAEDLYYTLEQAQRGFITRGELMSHATAEDREDGFIVTIPDREENPNDKEISDREENSGSGDNTSIENGEEGTENTKNGENQENGDTGAVFLPEKNPQDEMPDAEAGKWTSFELIDYQESDFTQFQHEGSVTQTYKVADSIGNTNQKTITVYIVDTSAASVEAEGTTRFIDEKYFNKSYENGGLEENSIWKTDPEYRAVLESAFSNLRNHMPEQIFQFTHDEVVDLKQKFYQTD